MSFTLYNCINEVISPVPDPCFEDIEHGRVRGVAFIHKSYLAALLAAPEDNTVWQTGITTEKIHIIPETTGSFDGGSPIEGAGYGDNASKFIGFNFGLNYKDPAFKNNLPFYNTLSKAPGWHICWRTESLSRISKKPVSVVAKSPVAEDINSEVVWDVEVKWAEKEQPGIFATADAMLSYSFT